MRWSIIVASLLTLGWGLARARPVPAGVATSTTGEALRATVLPLAAAPGWDSVDGVMVAIRHGQVPPAELWTRPGLAGLAALEARRAGRTDLDTQIAALAEQGPTPMDELAARWALHDRR